MAMHRFSAAGRAPSAAGGPLGRVKTRLLDRPLGWVKRELAAARRDRQDDQFLATKQGEPYPARDLRAD
jgi:hypothetical protein